MTRLYIIRHGTTDFNKQNRYLGRTDLSLTNSGREQAFNIKNYIEKLGVDIVISSPLKRATETAEIIKPTNIRIIVDFAFIERSVGIYEGLTKEEARKKHPDLFAKNITRIFNKAPTGGETILEVQRRVFIGLDKIKKIYRGKNILIVMHAFVAKVVDKYFNKKKSEKEFFDFILQTTEVKEYEFN